MAANGSEDHPSGDERSAACSTLSTLQRSSAFGAKGHAVAASQKGAVKMRADESSRV
jgi:hypothetical protein